MVMHLVQASLQTRIGQGYGIPCPYLLSIEISIFFVRVISFFRQVGTISPAILLFVVKPC